MIAIIDYGMGNLKSIYKALKYVNADSIITSDPEVVKNADAVVLPGVGAFKDAMECIVSSNMEEAIKVSIGQEKPFLGICLGMQVLFEKSYEYGEYNGLSIVKGEVLKLPDSFKVPHMGWNNLKILNEDPLFYGVDAPYVYFVHSYYCKPAENIISSTTEYGMDVTASIWKGNVHGLQFHPEKSGEQGLKMLDNFRRMIK